MVGQSGATGSSCIDRVDFEMFIVYERMIFLYLNMRALLL